MIQASCPCSPVYGGQRRWHGRIPVATPLSQQNAKWNLRIRPGRNTGINAGPLPRPAGYAYLSSLLSTAIVPRQPLCDATETRYRKIRRRGHFVRGDSHREARFCSEERSGPSNRRIIAAAALPRALITGKPAVVTLVILLRDKAIKRYSTTRLGGGNMAMYRDGMNARLLADGEIW
ncbi:hypothetical protein KM043_010060 [Ampulex compressa]|nr:hypothetical protein KM043_010060 [Ampulex compressa]